MGKSKWRNARNTEWRICEVNGQLTTWEPVRPIIFENPESESVQITGCQNSGLLSNRSEAGDRSWRISRKASVPIRTFFVHMIVPGNRVQVETFEILDSFDQNQFD